MNRENVDVDRADAVNLLRGGWNGERKTGTSPYRRPSDADGRFVTSVDMRHVLVFSSMPDRHAPGVGREEPLHARREAGYRGADHEVEVIRHQDEADDRPPGPGNSSGQEVLEMLSVVVVLHDFLSGIAPRHDVVDGSLELNSQSSGHRLTRPEKRTAFALVAPVCYRRELS